MTGSKKPAATPDGLLDAASKDAKIELSEKELERVTGGFIVQEHEKLTGEGGSRLFQEAASGSSPRGKLS